MFKGLVYLQVSSEEVPQGELRSQVLVNSAHCIHGSPPLPNNGDFCNAGNNRYYEGESWIDEDDKCISCTCKVTWRELLLTKNRDIFRGYSQESLMGGMAPSSPNHDTIRNKEKAIFHTRCYWTWPYPFAFTGMASESCTLFANPFPCSS